jgi:LysR family glycine cleavage system transcriptional activator
MHLPETRTLQAFVATAQLGSLAAAGPYIGMSVPALSRRLAALERDLGVHLFRRVPQGMILTDAGRGYLVHAAASLDRLRAAAAELHRDRAVVRVTTIPAFATRWLLPRLPAFTERHPDIAVDLQTSLEFEQLEAGGFDLAVRLALDAEMPQECLLPIHLMPVWSAGQPWNIERPDDVLHHPLLGPAHRPEFWPEWMLGVGLDDRAAVPRTVDPLLLYESTLIGQGVAIGIAPLVSDLLQRGRLHGLSAYRVRSRRSFFLIGRAAHRTRAARLFTEWMQAQAQLTLTAD